MKTDPSKSFSWITATLLCVVVGLLVACLSIFLQTRPSIANAYSAEYIRPALPAAHAGVGTSFEVPTKPYRLVIPAIGVDAHIQSVGLSWRGNGEMGVPTNFTDVGWYNKGPIPGMPGNAVIDGHVDGKDVEKAVFYDLGTLAPGDEVQVIDEHGTTLRFRVVASVIYDQDASAVDVFIGDASKARLNLITCSGEWDADEKRYSKRTVVFTELVTD